jgi:hypothetical protein
VKPPLPNMTKTRNGVIPKRRLTAIAVATATLVGLVAAGCGSSSSSNSTSTAALTKAEFLVKGNAICKAGNKVTNAAASKAFPNNAKPTEVQVAAYGRIVAPLIQTQINGIRALGAPSGDESAVKGMLDTAQQDLDMVKSNPDLLVKGDVFANFAKVAHPYGLTSCAPQSGK